MGGGKRNRGQPRHSSNSSSTSSVATSSAGAASLAGTSSSDTDLLSLTKEQLKIECRRRGQKTSGNKLELLQRLSHNKNMQSLHQTGSGAGSSSGQSTSHNRRNKQDASTVTVNGDTRQTRRTSGSSNSSAQRQREKDERESIVLWKKPITTLDYSSRQLVFYIRSLPHSIIENLKSVTIAILSCLAIGTYVFMGPPEVRSTLMWGLYWVGLGLLSSVGFGTGLHTFILYLGPHIAKVTLAAYECGSLNFPEPPYPDEIVCPVEADPSWAVSIWNIMSKVRFEAMMWGAGTALGELPPYFMARASRLSGYDPNDEDDLREFEELQRKKREDPSSMTTLDRAKVFVERLVERVGFFGILACASIPNPLFDLAGITCGHFLVPFWTFFGATLIGKAVVKMHLQQIFVIIAFNETLIENAVSLLAFVPVIGIKLQEPFKEFLNKQKLKLHRKPGTSLGGDTENSVLASIFEKFIIAMFLYFAISIVNSLAQSYHKRLHKETKSGSRRSKCAID